MNLKPIRETEETDAPQVKPKRRRRRLRTIAMLPTLLTLGNLYFGFLAIYYCSREMHNVGKGMSAASKLTFDSQRWEDFAPTYLSIASIMLVAAMLCDAFDGRVARLTKGTSKFGELMDSLADVVSFGAAPALMMVTLVRRELIEWAPYVPFGFERFGQAVVLFGGVFACCTALRLARFSVEASIEEANHSGFRGLPSPGGAGAVISLVYLHDHLDGPTGWIAGADFITQILPFCTLAVALLMVSRIPYTHALNTLLKRRPFGHAVTVLLVVPLIILYTELSLAILAWVFVLSGPLRMLWRRRHGLSPHTQSDMDNPQELQQLPSQERQAQ